MTVGTCETWRKHEGPKGNEDDGTERRVVGFHWQAGGGGGGAGDGEPRAGIKCTCIHVAMSFYNPYVEKLRCTQTGQTLEIH